MHMRAFSRVWRWLCAVHSGVSPWKWVVSPIEAAAIVAAVMLVTGRSLPWSLFVLIVAITGIPPDVYARGFRRLWGQNDNARSRVR